MLPIAAERNTSSVHSIAQVGTIRNGPPRRHCCLRCRCRRGELRRRGAPAATSPAAVTRAVSALESRLGTRLLNRTTRAVSLTDVGLRQLGSCRRVLAEVASLETSAASRGGGAAGPPEVTAPVVFGRLHLLPVLLRLPAASTRKVSARLLLLDRVVSLVEEGIDVGPADRPHAQFLAPCRPGGRASPRWSVPARPISVPAVRLRAHRNCACTAASRSRARPTAGASAR